MARNRNRQAGPIRRTLITPAPITVGTSPALRAPALVVVTGPGPRMGRAKGGGMPAGNGSGISLWHQPADLPYSVSVLTGDRRWTSTVSDHG